MAVCRKGLGDCVIDVKYIKMEASDSQYQQTACSQCLWPVAAAAIGVAITDILYIIITSR